MVSPQAHVARFVSRMRVKRDPHSAHELVAHLRVAMNSPPIPHLPVRGVRFSRFAQAGLRGELHRTEKPARAVLYLHGGGYIAGAPHVYRNLCSRLAKGLDAEVWVPDYRLAPEHPFPAALEDAVAAYRMLLERGYRPRQISVAGDSAGGGLTLATLLYLRDHGLPMPRCAIAMSPLADLTFENASILRNDRSDAMLSNQIIRRGHGLYARPEDAEHPHASPAFGDYEGLPPLLVTVDEEECLRDDAYAVVERARRAQVPVEFLSRRGLMHVWPILVPVVPEANTDVERMLEFVRRS